jgi:peptidoglycan/xylan/chitin deacetylase (PgdA/CDA1 family)
MMLKTAARKLIPGVSQLISTRLVQRLAGRFVPIFMLHRLQHADYGIQGQRADAIRKHLEYFRKHGYQAISLAELGRHIVAGTPPPYQAAVFTIDDGFIDHHDIAAPLFAEFDIPLTFFLVSDFIDGKLWPWDDQLGYIIEHASAGTYHLVLNAEHITLTLTDASSRHAALRDLRARCKRSDNSALYAFIEDCYVRMQVARPDSVPRAFKPMSWAQANALVAQGHCVAAHTCSHRILSQLDDTTASYEITHSIDTVQAHVPGAANVFAYPTGRSGDFTQREIAILQSRNVDITVSTEATTFIVADTYDVRTRHSVPRFPLPDEKIDFVQYLGWIEFLKSRCQRTH